MASPSVTVLCTAATSFRLAPNMVVLFFLAAALLATPTRSSSPSSNGTGLQQSTVTCSGHSPYFTSSSAAVTRRGEEVTRFLAAVCAGAYGGDAHMSHNMSAYVVAENRTMYGVAQCRPDVSVSDCAACLAAASKLIISGTRCVASAIWHDACFLRYSDHDDPGRFREDEYTATVFNASRAPLAHEGAKAALRRLLAATGKRTTSSNMCRSVGAGTAASGGGRIYGLTRCAAGISCADCRRCLGGALAVVDREYNGSAGMQVLRLSCMARYESYPFYNYTKSHQRLLGGVDGAVVASGGRRTASTPAATPPVPEPPPYVVRDPFYIAPIVQQPPPAHRMIKHPLARLNPTFIGLIISFATGLAIAAITIWYLRKWRPAQRGHVIEPLALNHQADGKPKETMHDQGKKNLSREEENDEDEGRTSCQLYSYQVLEDATCRFSSRNKPGSGGFGTVYKGTLENGKKVAVKRIRDSKRTIQELEREISIVANLHHKNLMRFLGYCFQEDGRFLIYEYVPNNSLDKFWYKASFQCEKLEWALWFNIILGVARGLRFLHDKGIIHRDLKPHNVLLDDNFNPKIADFDLMRMYDKQKTHESTEKIAGTL